MLTHPDTPTRRDHLAEGTPNTQVTTAEVKEQAQALCLVAPFASLPTTVSASICWAGRLHGEQFEAEVTQPVEQPVQVRLVTHLANEHRLAGSGFQRHPVESGLEVVTQPPA